MKLAEGQIWWYANANNPYVLYLEKPGWILRHRFNRSVRFAGKTHVKTPNLAFADQFDQFTFQGWESFPEDTPEPAEELTREPQPGQWYYDGTDRRTLCYVVGWSNNGRRVIVESRSDASAQVNRVLSVYVDTTPWVNVPDCPGFSWCDDLVTRFQSLRKQIEDHGHWSNEDLAEFEVALRKELQ